MQKIIPNRVDIGMIYAYNMVNKDSFLGKDMKIFNYDKYKKIALDSETISLIAKIYEKKGEQGAYIDKDPEMLSVLVEVSKIQSTEASNRIEGIVTTSERINALLKRGSRPLNRDEEEIKGYRDVLNTIHNNYEHIPFNANYIRQLHRDLLKFTSLLETTSLTELVSLAISSCVLLISNKFVKLNSSIKNIASRLS